MAALRFSLLAIICACLVASSFANEFHADSVLELNSNNWESKVNDGKLYFIKFYAPWCGHCKRLAPAWKELGEAVKDNEGVVIAHIDCTQDRQICQDAEIRGYPTLKVFHKGEEYKAYKGARDVDSLKKFVLDAATDLLTEAN